MCNKKIQYKRIKKKQLKTNKNKNHLIWISTDSIDFHKNKYSYDSHSFKKHQLLTIKIKLLQ
jgi:hypothetical protein